MEMMEGAPTSCHNSGNESGDTLSVVDFTHPSVNPRKRIMHVSNEQIAAAQRVLRSEGLPVTCAHIGEVLGSTDYGAIRAYLKDQKKKNPCSSGDCPRMTPEFVRSMHAIMQGIADRAASRQTAIYESRLAVLRMENKMLRDVMEKAGHLLSTQDGSVHFSSHRP